MSKPLTGRDLERVRGRFIEAMLPYAPLAKAVASAKDVPLLLDELERVYESHAECWMMLDWIARRCAGGPLKPLGDKCAELLRRQQAPGWKEDKR